MSQNYRIRKKCLRYIVPFTFVNDFESAIEAIEVQKEIISVRPNQSSISTSAEHVQRTWIRNALSDNGSESDLYDYIRNEVIFDADDGAPLPDYRIGGEWLYWRSRDCKSNGKLPGYGGKPILKLLSLRKRNGKSDEEPMTFDTIEIRNLGIMIFRNHLGFLWYEAEVPHIKDSDQLVMFQNQFRELNRGRELQLFREISKSEPQCGIVVSENHGYRTYAVPLLMGEWIASILGFLSVTFLAERSSSYQGFLKTISKNIEFSEEEHMKLGHSEHKKVPDKALLLTYCTFDSIDKEDDGARESLAYHITNGYKTSYRYSEEIGAEMRHPFQNAIWYATQEGVSYLAWPDRDNGEAFDVTIYKRFKGDYQALYMKALYQSYSLLIYAQRIQREISAVDGEWKCIQNTARRLDLFEEINLFLTKSMATTVSHIHHQSDFYVYLKRQLRIHEDVKSVTAGINALDALKRENRQIAENKRVLEEQKVESQRDNQIQAIMGLFAILGIFSALVDCFDFIQKFTRGGEWSALTTGMKLWEIGGLLVIVVIGLLAVLFAVKAIISAFRRD